MKLLSYIVFFLILALCTANVYSQQLFSYTQYMQQLTPLNPAYSVIDKAGSVNALVRRQWTGIEGAPSTFIFNGNLPIENIDAATGLIVLNDHFAVEDLTEINAFFAKSIRLNDRQSLAVSLNGGLRRYVAAYSQLDYNDPQFKNDVRETRPNIGFGVMFYSDTYYVSISIPEFTTRTLGQASQTNNTFFRSHYNFSGAWLSGLDDDPIRVKPAMLVTYAKGVPLIADLSTTIYLSETLGLGLNYRTNREVAGIISASFDTFRLGYSYQFGTASNNIAQGFKMNTHELTLTYRFGTNLQGKGLL